MNKIFILILALFALSIISLWQYDASSQCQDIEIVVNGEASEKISVLPAGATEGTYNNIVTFDKTGQLIIDMPQLCSAGMNKDANFFLNSILKINNKSGDTIFLKLTKEGSKKNAFYFGTVEHGVELAPFDSFIITLEINTCTECEKNNDMLTKITITAT